jgi:hypothetical protein
MSESQRPLNTFHAFCSLLLPGLGQLCQKRPGAAIGFFALFILAGFLPVHIVNTLYMSRFEYQPLPIHILHIAVFGGLFFLFILAIFWSVFDAIAWKPKPIEEQEERPRFSLAKLLVGIVFAGFLIALLLPAVPAAREPGRRMFCSHKMKQIVFAFHEYHKEYGHLPPAFTVDEDGKLLHSWRVLILPYIEQQELYEQIRLDEPWDSEHNQQFHSEAPAIFRCPSSVKSMPDGCNYSVVVGEKAAFNGSQPRKYDDFTSGTANTIFLVERKTPVNWMAPSREISFEAACDGINIDAVGISSFHTTALVAFADGRVQAMPDGIDGKLLRSLLAIDAMPPTW